MASDQERDEGASFIPITALVARAIAAHPDRVAVETSGGLLTYAELDARADDVAVTMQRSGSGPGGFVPVLAPDRRDLAVALLAVLRTGGVVAPLDPDLPAAQLRQAIAAVAPEHVLLGSGAADDPAVAAGLAAAAPQAVRLQVADPTGTSGTVGPAPHRAGPDDPCTVFSTSGTTGTPKAIVGRWSGLDHFVRWEAGLLGAQPGWRYGQLTSPAFDAVLRDLFLPLTTGGTVCAPPDGTRRDPAALRRWLDAEAITVLHTVPSVLRRLLDAPGGDLPALRWVVLSGERLLVDDARRFLDVLGHRAQLVNLYGPTETTMTKTFHVVERADLELSSIPVGRPLPGTEVLVLDDAGRPVAGGALGEVHLRTPHRALGYLGDPEATTSAFDGDTYRTGDFGRLLPGGVLEFLGRADHQVKIGGVRVELEGVAAVLRADVAVADAVAVVAEDGTHVRAFVEPAPGADPDPAGLRALAAERLPAAAVPAAVAVLAALPRTISGKVDRRSLPAADAAPTGTETAPRTPTERAVGRIWTAVLPTAGLDVHRGFFAAGGTSLLVIELLARLGTELGAEVPLGAFLSGPTVAEVAAVVEQVLGGGDEIDELEAA